MLKEIRTNLSSGNEKNNTSWYAVKVFSDSIIFAGQSGKFVNIYPHREQKLLIQTDLDLPLVVTTDSGFAAIGRWNTNLISWNANSNEQKILSPQLFKGRSNALYYHNSTIYVSGADKVENDNSNDSKDQVKLLQGVLYSIKLNGQFEKVELNNEGQITHLLVGDGWMAWIDGLFENTIMVKSDKNGIHNFNCKTPITSICTDEKLIYCADSDGIFSIDPESMKKKELYQFESIDFQILKLVKLDNHFYGMTSEGVFEIQEEKKMNKKEDQPIDIGVYKNEIIVLWHDGTFEYIKRDGTVVQDTIY